MIIIYLRKPHWISFWWGFFAPKNKWVLAYFVIYPLDSGKPSKGFTRKDLGGCSERDFSPRSDNLRYYRREKRMKITFRQSWINNFLRCPEQARQERAGLVQQRETSDLLRGNAVHHAIEKAGGSPIVIVTPPQLLDWVDEYIAENANAVEVWRQPYEKIVDVSRANVLAWYDKVWPQLGVPRAVERPFKKKIGKRKGVELWLSGTADWEDESGEIWDWKNPSRFYEPWEKRRWDIQSHAYCWALGADKFNLAVFANGEYQHIPIERNEADLKAFIDLCWSIVPLITAEVEPWPMNWTGWHCSPKWCPVWQAGKCRGKHLGQGKPESW